MGAYKRDVVSVIEIGAYIHRVLTCYGCILSRVYRNGGGGGVVEAVSRKKHEAYVLVLSCVFKHEIIRTCMFPCKVPVRTYLYSPTIFIVIIVIGALTRVAR